MEVALESQNLKGLDYGVKHVRSNEDCLLAMEVARHLTQNDSYSAEELVHFGSVYVNDQRAKDISLVVKVGDYLRIHSQPRRFSLKTLEQENRIQYEDAEWLVVNKPSGIPVHPLVDNKVENVISWFQTNYKSELYITHRLDVATNGLLVFAKSKEAQTKFNALLHSRKVKKTYRALVQGDLSRLESVCNELGSAWTHFMTPSEFGVKTVSRHANKDWLECKLAILDAVQENSNVIRLDIDLLTGRTQQIRSQLAHEGFPILGDVSYGAEEVPASKDSVSIELSCIELNWPGVSIRLK